MNELVVIEKAAEITGYSQKALRKKIEDGVLLEGHEYVRAPDGRVLIDLPGFNRWARGEPLVCGPTARALGADDVERLCEVDSQRRPWAQ